ncbi:MAG: DUF2336 domain-containing protein [Beijerinckiaceae bacterium]
MDYADILAGELSLISRDDLSDRRSHAVARLVREFERQAPALREDGVELYDVALRWLIADLETPALAALSERLADIPNAPHGAIRLLAFHDDVTVAGPVLSRSLRLQPGDLVAVVGSKGQEHIVLVARRADLTEPVTDQIIARGSANVLQTLAANGRAPLSEDGQGILVRRAGADHRLADALANRFGLPDRLRARLIDDATNVLRAHLGIVFNQPPPGVIDQAIKASLAVGAAHAGDGSAIGAEGAPISHRPEAGSADLSHEAPYLELLRRRQLREALQIVAERAKLSHELVLTIFSSNDLESMLNVLRAADMSWPAAEETLASRASGLDRWALREMMRNKFHMMSMRDAGRRLRFVTTDRLGAFGA